MHYRRNESSSSASGDQSSPMIVAVTRTRRNESRCSNRAGTLEQLREVKRKTSRQSLYSIRNGTGSQWRTSRRNGVMWSYFLLLQMSLAAALSTAWSPSRRHAGAPASRLLQRSTRLKVDTCMYLCVCVCTCACVRVGACVRVYACIHVGLFFSVIICVYGSFAYYTGDAAVRII